MRYKYISRKCSDQVIISRTQICSVEFDRKDIPMNKMVATTLEGKYHLFDMRTQHPKKGFASLVERVRVHVSLLEPSLHWHLC